MIERRCRCPTRRVRRSLAERRASRCRTAASPPSLASSDDPYGGLDHQRRAAGAWGATFIELGRLGHVNEASELGFWERGYELITAFRTGLAGQ